MKAEGNRRGRERERHGKSKPETHTHTERESEREIVTVVDRQQKQNSKEARTHCLEHRGGGRTFQKSVNTRLMDRRVPVERSDRKG